MKRALRIVVVLLVVFLVAGSIGFFGVLPGKVDRDMNVNLPKNWEDPAQAARDLHSTLLVADLHADPLLWPRDLLVRSDYGHVDIPRLIEGNVALQIFSAVTKTPKNQNYESNSDKSDNITALAMASRWPAETWTSLLARAKHQAQKLHKTAARSGGQLKVIMSASELEDYLATREDNPNQVAGILAVEGAHCLEGKIENVTELYGAGYRMVGITHFFDNELGGSAHGEAKGGLTDFGREVVQLCEEKGMIIDLAHASPAVYDDVLEMATRPIVVSHGGVRGTCDNVRNISDEMLERIAANGGVIGIGYWDAAICDPSPSAWADAIEHAVSVAGVDHIALGSDYDGATAISFDTSELSVLTGQLLERGFSEEDIAKIMGGNTLRLLGELLPGGDPQPSAPAAEETEATP